MFVELKVVKGIDFFNFIGVFFLDFIVRFFLRLREFVNFLIIKDY